MRILLAEDEVALSGALVKIFERNHYSVDAVYTGEDALTYLAAGNYDVLVLDVMMPHTDGIEVLRTLRAKGDPIPVLILSARGETDDRVQGLDAGANYYLTKPFETRELLAAIRAITRADAAQNSRLTFGNITLDRAAFTLASPTGEVRLTNKEYQMMEMLMSDPNRLISAERLMERIWGYDSEVEINVVWVYISYLRRKLIALEADIGIKASRNAGYSLEALS